MLMNPKWKEYTFDIGKQILFDTKNHKSVGIVISDATYDTDFFVETGIKLVRAGMPVTGDLEDRLTAFTVTTGTNGVGVLWHDVDVTAGPANGTLIVEGHVNRDRLDDSVNTFYDTNGTIIASLSPNVKLYRDN